MPKIRLASKSGTLEVSLMREMQSEGYTRGRIVKWVKTSDGWLLTLDNGAAIGVPVASDAQVATETQASSGEAGAMGESPKV